MGNFSDHPSVRGIASRQVLEHPFTFEPVSSTYVKEILENLNPQKAVGANSISPRLLRLSAPVMAEEITRLINFLIPNRSWPNEWKCRNLTPMFKKDEDARKENYRPVSVLTTLSKVYEKVMSPLVTKLLWISKKPFVLHRSSENDRGLEKEP